MGHRTCGESQALSGWLHGSVSMRHDERGWCPTASGPGTSRAPYPTLLPSTASRHQGRPTYRPSPRTVQPRGADRDDYGYTALARPSCDRPGAKSSSLSALYRRSRSDNSRTGWYSCGALSAPNTWCHSPSRPTGVGDFSYSIKYTISKVRYGGKSQDPLSAGTAKRL